MESGHSSERAGGIQVIDFMGWMARFPRSFRKPYAQVEKVTTLRPRCTLRTRHELDKCNDPAFAV